MADYAYIPRKTKGIFDPASKAPFKLSRSKIDLFTECPRCFYLDRRLGVGRPPGFPFNLNSAVDTLLKKEFDAHRVASSTHPLMKQYGIDAVPYMHAKLSDWRENFTGVQHVHAPSGFLVFGAVDDIWVNPEGELIVVDYKATSKDGEVNLDAEWQDGYKRQMEVYQWLLRQNGCKVNDTGYFVYANGLRDRAAFDARLEFDIKIIPYTGSTDWIPPTLARARACLMDDRVPAPADTCDYCKYRRAAAEATEEQKQKSAPTTSSPAGKNKEGASDGDAPRPTAATAAPLAKKRGHSKKKETAAPDDGTARLF